MEKLGKKNTFEEFISVAKTVLETNKNDFIIRYLDDENDILTINDNDDYIQYLNFIKENSSNNFIPFCFICDKGITADLENYKKNINNLEKSYKNYMKSIVDLLHELISHLKNIYRESNLISIEDDNNYKIIDNTIEIIQKYSLNKFKKINEFLSNVSKSIINMIDNEKIQCKILTNTDKQYVFGQNDVEFSLEIKNTGNRNLPKNCKEIIKIIRLDGNVKEIEKKIEIDLSDVAPNQIKNLKFEFKKDDFPRVFEVDALVCISVSFTAKDLNNFCNDIYTKTIKYVNEIGEASLGKKSNDLKQLNGNNMITDDKRSIELYDY